MQYTFGQLKDVVRHAIAGTPDSGAVTQRFTEGQIVNRAIAHLYSAAGWSWRQVLTTLSLTINVGSVALPADFGELVMVAPTSALATCQVRRVPPGEFMRLASSVTYNATSLGYMLGAATQSATTSAPVMSLMLAPTPLATVANALSVLYLKTTPTLAATGTADDAKVIDCPAKVHHVLVALCRAYAVSTEDQQDGIEWKEAKEALAAAIEAEGRAEGEFDGAVLNDGTHTFAGLKAQAAAVLGDEASRHNLARMVNDAQQLIYSAAGWNWTLETVDLSVDTTDTVNDTLKMPINFGSCKSIINRSGVPVEIVQPEYWQRVKFRNGEVGGYLVTFVSLGQIYPTVAVTSGHAMGMRIYPRPQDDEDFQLTFHRLQNRMTTEAEVPSMPPQFHILLAYAVRACADRMRTKPTGVHQEPYERMLKDMIEQDANMYPVAARLRPVLFDARNRVANNDVFQGNRFTVDY